MTQKQSDREQEIADITHPSKIAHSAKAPVMNRLRYEEGERQQADQSKARIGGP
jgi:hypothetical protein